MLQFSVKLTVLQVATTRPDLAAVLRQTMAAHSGSQEISVFVAGGMLSQTFTLVRWLMRICSGQLHCQLCGAESTWH